MSKPPLSVLFAPDASRDLIQRAGFLAIEGSLRISDRFLEAVAHTVDLLTQMPKIGSVFRSASNRKSEIRTMPVSGAFHRSVIFYTATTTELRIQRILHSSQNLTRFFR
jgi:plasmid stabilization system protein ParE